MKNCGIEGCVNEGHTRGNIRIPLCELHFAMWGSYTSGWEAAGGKRGPGHKLFDGFVESTEEMLGFLSEIFENGR